MSLSVECVAFLWPLCEWSHRAVNGQASDKECMGRIFTPLTVMLISQQEKVLVDTEKTIWFIDA